MANIVWRATVMTHRYLGVLVGLLMLMWFASGIVMMYVGYPAISPKERVRALPEIAWQNCCHFPASIPGDDEIGAIEIEDVAGAPVMRLRPKGFGPQRSYDLSHDGATLKIDDATAKAIAVALAPGVVGHAAMPVSFDKVERDQWTVGGNYRRDLPLYRFAFDDAAATRLYISSTTGAAVLWTTGSQRLWNWFGAIPHWLYLQSLRSQPAVWSQVVIWTSVLGTFLTALGLVLGILQIKDKARGYSPYRGWFYWHHVMGLVFGILTLTWVVSGLLSMNPWGLLESDGGGDERAAIVGKAPVWSDVRASLVQLQARGLPSAVRLSTAPYDGKLYWLVARSEGTTERVDAMGNFAPVTPSDLAGAAKRLAGSTGIESQIMLTEEDAYYYGLHEAVVLPAYRVILNDPGHTRYYFDPATGSLIGRLDTTARWNRWLFNGLHSLDFTAIIRARPIWDVLMVALLLGGLGLTGTGTYLGIRRALRDLRLTRRV